MPTIIYKIRLSFFAACDELVRGCRVSKGRATALICAFALSGCERGPQQEVVVYTSVDQQFAVQILARFEQDSGLQVVLVADIEASKTTGLVRRLMRERDRPRCDVWWSSEVFGTIELARNEVLEPYESPAAADIPQEWKDARHRWTGLAPRARVVAYNPKRTARDALPDTWRAIGDHGRAARLALANPQFGTTRGHVGAMFAYWGAPDAVAFLETLRAAGARITGGNSMAVQTVLANNADFCMTDTDDVWVARARGRSIDMVYPALEPGGPPMWIPCTVALVRGGPNPARGRRLIDYLVSADVERALMNSDSRNVPVRAAVRSDATFETPEPAALDFERIADAIPGAMRAARDILLQ